VTIYVYRTGEEIRTCPEEEFRALISSGRIRPDDYFRFESSSEWSLVSTYTPPDRLEPEQRSRTDTTKPKHDWRLDSATEKQIHYLSSFGVTAPAGITKGEASDLIERCTNDLEALARQAQLRETRYEQERRNRAAFPSFYLRSDIASAAREVQATKERRNKTKVEIATKRKELAAAQRKLERAKDDNDKGSVQTEIENIKSDLDLSESELSDLPVELEDAERELKDARSKRLRFWKATFKEDWILTGDEDRLIDFADTIDQLYAECGRYFKIPTNKQVTDVLEALDKDSRDWDKREPSAFYLALKARVPDCTRSVRPVTPSRSQGCLVFLMGIVSVVAYYVIIR